MGDYSTILFAKPSFSEGVSRLVDFGGTLTEFNRSPSPELADFFALSADWRAIGEDFWVEMQRQAEGLNSVEEVQTPKQNCT